LIIYDFIGYLVKDVISIEDLTFNNHIMNTTIEIISVLTTFLPFWKTTIDDIVKGHNKKTYVKVCKFIKKTLEYQMQLTLWDNKGEK
jgi:hypothetical protein